MTVILLRVLHVVLGVFWGGTILFNAFFLQPALRDAGPDGAKVMAGMVKRHMMTVVPIAAILTILSGLWLYWRLSNGFDHHYVHSAAGATYGLGGLAGIIALAVGLSMIRPNMTRAAAIMQHAPAAGPEREAAMAEARRLRERAASANNVVTVLMVGTLLAMAVARYL